MQVRKRYYIKKGEIKDIVSALTSTFGEPVARTIVPPKASVERIELDGDEELVAVNNQLALWKRRAPDAEAPEAHEWVPLLSLVLEHPGILKTVVVDMGAVRFVTNGADVMRPGVLEIDPTIEEGDVVKVVDVKNRRPLAIGKALGDAKDLEAQERGKIVANLETITDKLWEYSQSF